MNIIDTTRRKTANRRTSCDRRQGNHAHIAAIALTFGAIAALSVLLLAGCDNTFSIFQTISQEKKQTGADLFLNTTVRAMADDSKNYYALLGQVFYRDQSGTSWNVLPVDGSSTYFASGLASDGTTIYVAKSDANNVLSDIFSTSDQGAHWTALHATTAGSSPLSGYSVDWIKCANGILFVGAHTASDSYAIFYYDSSTTAFKSSGVTGLSVPLMDIVYDGKSQYWAISTSDVYVGTAPGSLAIDSSSGNPSSAGGLVGIATDGAGRIVVTRNDGYLYSNESGSWKPRITIKASTKLGPAFFLALPGASARILVGKGSASYGYMEYDESAGKLYDGGSNFVSTSSSIYYGAILNKTVIGFWQPSNDVNTIFVLLASGGTSSYALYRNKFDGTTSKWSGWAAE